MKTVTILVALLLSGCFFHSDVKKPLNPGVPDPTPIPKMSNDPDGLDTIEGQACANMRKLACSDGLSDKKGTTCYKTLMRIEADRIIVPSMCLANAGNINILRECGDENTMRVRCP